MRIPYGYQMENNEFTDFVPRIRKDFYDSINEEKRKDFEGIFTDTEIINRYIRENTNNGPISLTQLAKEYSEESPGYVIQSWMRSRNFRGELSVRRKAYAHYIVHGDALECPL